MTIECFQKMTDENGNEVTRVNRSCNECDRYEQCKLENNYTENQEEAMPDSENLWEKAAEIIEAMPAKLRNTFSEHLADSVKKENQKPEKEYLAETSCEAIKLIKMSAKIISDDMDGGALKRYLSDIIEASQDLWKMQNRLDEIQRAEQSELKRQKAQKMLDAGFVFRSVEIDGETIYRDDDGNATLVDADAIPF